MAVRKFRPITPGTRFRIANTYAELTGDAPEKSLTKGIKSSGGRNHVGKMTMRNLGKGHKKSYRLIDFKRDKIDIPCTVKTIEYDPNRSAFIALVTYIDGEKRYILAPKGIKVGDTILSGKKAQPETGHHMLLSDVPLGADIHNVEITPGRGGALARSAGTAAQMIGKEEKYVVIKLPSGEIRRILATCTATIGTTSNQDHNLQILGKAGRNRHAGRRPRVRGVAMNPVDHPMGGGEGRASGGHPRSRTGIMAKGQKTRNVHKKSSQLIIQKRKK